MRIKFFSIAMTFSLHSMRLIFLVGLLLQFLHNSEAQINKVRHIVY